MAGQQLPPGQIDAQPTKTFFVDMLVRDIPLEQAVLDLVDNSVDGAKFMHNASDRFDGRQIKLTVNSDEFIIWDNCGGFSIEAARDYAFRFGRKIGTPKTPHSIGQFGVGMKRALFKFGEHFVVRSATEDEVWAIDVDVAIWEADEKNWHFPWSEFKESELSTSLPGTEIIVDRLRPEVSARFGTQHFVNTIIGLVKSKHRQFILSGLSISINGTHLDATNLCLAMTDKLSPGVDILSFETEGEDSVDVRIVVGVGTSSPREAGWYVICNGRVILEADRRSVTGWGVLEEEAGRTLIPSYHNQFSRFRGIVSFDSSDSSRIPWNTTK
ncbi:MAG: ATP-binding protein, partial [Alphaproteobacteria bacterium]|nr:ATP-binding protein [Alphaproteobacteria bacterium]